MKEQGKSRIDSTDLKFIRRRTKIHIARQKTIQDILLELKINPVVKKIENYRDEWKKHVLGNGQQQTDRLPHVIMKYQPCGERSEGRPLKRLQGC